jgi:DNA-binding NarL/FixJ family response regulator
VNAGPLRLVIVDDHGVVRRGVRALLETHPGWQVVAEGGNGREAVELVRELRPDVIILDLSMPDMNGLEATRRIVEESPQTEVLVLTMHHSEQLAREVLQAGARGYLLKSDADQNLIAAVDSLSQHKPFLTSTVTEFVLDGYMQLTDRSEVDDGAAMVTPREREIIQLIAEGHSSKQTATVLSVSVKTVDAHRANIMRKLRLRSVSDLVRYAIRNQIVQP